jgi:hypothetical protein
MRCFARVIVSFCALTLAASAGAQGPTSNALTDSSRVTRVTFMARDTAQTASAVGVSSATVGAPLTGLRAGVHLRETNRASQPNAGATHANLGQARAMMVVGGAALIAGAIIGGTAGTLIMVGGAVLGLYGLYDYLQ